jgi:hypothetical protein
MSAQQNRSRSILDMFTTVVTIGTCILVVAVIAQQKFGTPSPVSPKVVVGAVLEPTADVTYGPTELTILVGLSSNCRFCEESMPAFRQLNEYVRSRAGRLRVFALALEPLETLGTYLQKNGLTTFRPITIDRRAALAVVAALTPQVVVVNRSGTVMESWTGRITERQMQGFVKPLVGAAPSR